MYFRKGDLKMKKSKLSIGLVTSFIGALALTACSSTPAVTSSKKNIVDFIGYNSKDDKIEIDIDKFYSEYGDSKEGTNLFYNAVLEALIRYEYKDLSERETELKSYASLVKEAEMKVTAQKQVARDNAKSNGTEYAKEWDKILEAYDVENAKELKEHFLYELEKEAITDWYFKSNQAELKNQYIGIDKNWKVYESDGTFDSVYPYHILHILVKLGADAGDYQRATISADEAEKLWSVVRKLLDSSYSFEDVAFSDSEDSSNTAYGDVGIMSTQTSFYNEFKLGVYAYDALLSGVNTQGNDKQGNDNTEIYKAFGVDNKAEVVTETLSTYNQVEKKEKVTDLVQKEMVTDVRNALTGYDASATAYANIPTIPYDVFRQIANVKDDEKIGTTELESGAVAYPRNVLFNQFLNFRSPFVITDEDIIISDSGDKVTTRQHDFVNGNPTNTYGEAVPDTFKLKETNFVQGAVPSLGNKNVLCDKKGNVIIGVRSTAGIHFMVMRKSVFYNTNLATVVEGAVTKADNSLQDYYTTEVPGSDDFPQYDTYVNMTKSDDSSYYTNRANTIKNKLKGADSSDSFDAAYDYRIYQMLLDDSLVQGKLHFFDEDETGFSQIEQNIEDMIQLLRFEQGLSNDESINDAWESYLIQLRNQNTLRKYKGMMSTSCVFKFHNEDKDAFEKGGACYVK